MNRRERRVVDVFVAALFCATMAVEVYLVIDFARAVRIQSWPTVRGRVVASELVTNFVGHTEYHADIRYTYSVGGIKHESASVRIRGTRTRYKLDVAEVVNNYPAGAEVLVYYNPDNVRESFLEAGVDILYYVTVISPLVFAGFFGAYLWRRFRDRRISSRAAQSENTALLDATAGRTSEPRLLL